MYDKAVRRRRAVLAVLVALSLILLTAYFGESARGSLHGVQRGALEVLAPIQEGANRVAQAVPRPVRLVRRHAERQGRARPAQEGARRAARRRSPTLAGRRRREQAAARAAGHQHRRRPEGLRAGHRARDRALADRWYSTVEINKGSSDGVARRPARRQRRGPRRQGHVGVRRQRARDADHRPGVRRLGQGRRLRRAGLDRPRGRRPRRPAARARPARQATSRKGERIVTAGTVSTRLESLFPPGIPIGTVSRVDEGEGELDRRIHVPPAADLRRLDYRPGAHEAEHRPAAPRRSGRRDADRPRDRPPRRCSA